MSENPGSPNDPLLASGTRQPLRRFGRLLLSVFKTAGVPVVLGLAWAAWGTWGNSPIDWRKAIGAFGSAFFFVSYLANYLIRASNQDQATERHLEVVATLDSIRKVLPAPVVSGAIASTLAPPTMTATGTVMPPSVVHSTQADLVEESSRALEAGLVRSSLMTIATALEIAAVRAVERVQAQGKDRLLGFSRTIVALSPWLTKEQRTALNRLRDLRNQLAHEVHLNLNAAQVQELHDAFRGAIALLDGIHGPVPG